MEIKKKIKNTVLKILLVAMFFSLLSCDFDFLSREGIDASEDSGFDLTINNFSDREYKNCTFYMGYKDTNNKFVTSDSLVFTNIIIYKKGDGDYYNAEKKFSSTDLFDERREGLNKYGKWAPTPEVTNASYKTGEIFFKVNLEGKISISAPAPVFNGNTILRILENGDLSW